MQYYSTIDVILIPCFLLILIFIAKIKGRKLTHDAPWKKLFLPGLVIKITGGLLFCAAYTLYYDGGDTTSYHQAATVVINVLFEYGPEEFFSIWLGETTPEKYALFNDLTGYPDFYIYGPTEYKIVRMLVPFELLSFKSYAGTTILISTIAYYGVWKLFEVFSEQFPYLYKELAIGVFFVPSLIFWMSGVSKDTLMFFAICTMIYCSYRLFICRLFRWKYWIFLFLAIYFIFEIRSVMLIVFAPAMIVWGTLNGLGKVQDNRRKIILLPVVAIITVLITIGGWTAFISSSEDYQTVEEIITQARIKSNDLKRDYYGGNSFDIGDYEPTIAGVISKFPAAVVAGLFRPFFWEAANIVMVVSGIESLLVLILVLLSLVHLTKFRFINKQRHLLLFCLMIAIILGFVVGISTSNFGALVRFRALCYPFLISFALILIRTQPRLLTAEGKLPSYQLSKK